MQFLVSTSSLRRSRETSGSCWRKSALKVSNRRFFALKLRIEFVNFGQNTFQTPIGYTADVREFRCLATGYTSKEFRIGVTRTLEISNRIHSTKIEPKEKKRRGTQRRLLLFLLISFFRSNRHILKGIFRGTVLSVLNSNQFNQIRLVHRTKRFHHAVLSCPVVLETDGRRIRHNREGKARKHL